MIVPDLNRDGKNNTREYYDDLGGAYYFRPPGLNKPINWPLWFRRIAPVIDALFWLAVGFFVLIIL